MVAKKEEIYYMALTEEQIKNILVKNIETKTILINKIEYLEIEKQYIKDGWKVKNKSEMGLKIKVTFQREKQ